MSEETNQPSVLNEWDSIIIQINTTGEKEDSPIGAVKMMKQDIDAMMNLHNVNRGEIFDLLVQALETTPPEQMAQIQ